MGHVFRDKSPYTFPGGVAKIVLHNAARVAEVWLDEWKEFYYAMSPGLQINWQQQQQYQNFTISNWINTKLQQLHKIESSNDWNLGLLIIYIS